MSSGRKNYLIRVKPEFVTLDTKSKHGHSSSSAGDEIIQSEFNEIKETCQRILKNQTIIMRDLKLIKKELRIVQKISENNEAGNNNEDINERSLDLTNKPMVQLPCSTVEDIEALEAKIMENEEYERFVLKYFEQIQEYELPKFIKSAFQAIMTDEVARCFTWYGLNQNRSIKDFKLIAIMIDVANKKFSEIPNVVTISFIKKYFLLCKDRNRKKQRSSKTESKLSTQNNSD